MSNTPILVPDRLIDSHVHLDFPQFDEDRSQVIQRAQSVGVEALVVPGVRASDWPRIATLCSEIVGLHACYGLHPCFCIDHQLSHLQDLSRWLERESVVAVGECGLDFSPKYVGEEALQRKYFEQQLVLAKLHGLPVVLHARRSVDAVLKCLRQAGVHQGVMHSFSGSLQQAKAAIDQGLHIGVGGAITYDRAKKLRAVLRSIPLDSIVLETDAPDQPGASHRGMRNEPSFIISVLSVLAEIRLESRLKIAEETSNNSARLFSLSRFQ